MSDKQHHIAQLGLLFFVAVTALSYCWLWATTFPSYMRPVIFSDLSADVTFLAGNISTLQFIFGQHNEHIVAPTRLLTVFDIQYFGMQYRLHELIGLAALTFTALILPVAHLKGAEPDKLGLAAIALGSMAILYWPILMAMPAFPYFTVHPLVSASSAACCVSAYFSLGKRFGSLPWIVLYLVAILSATLALTTAAHGFVAAIVAILMPIAMGQTSRLHALALTAAAVVIFCVWFVALRPASPPNLAFTATFLGAAFEYLLRLLGQPALFLGGGRVAQLSTGLLSILGYAAVIFLAFTWRQRSAALTLATALLIGHLASLCLVALGRAGTGWDPEGSKYLYYVSVALICSGAVCIVATSHSPLWRSSAIAGYLLVSLFGFATIPSMVVERSFFRHVEASVYATAMDIREPRAVAALSPHNDDFRSIRANLQRLKTYSLNLYAEPPFAFLKNDIHSIGRFAGCKGNVDGAAALETFAKGPAARFEGWAYAERVSDSAILIADQTGRIVGIGANTVPRADVVHFLKLPVIYVIAPRRLVGLRRRPTYSESNILAL